MADIKAEDILKRSKERSKVFDELINSPTHNKENAETAAPVYKEEADSSSEYGIHKFKKTGSGKVRNLCSRFENIIANETIDSRPASPNNRSIVSTTTIGSAHKPTTVVTKAGSRFESGKRVDSTSLQNIIANETIDSRPASPNNRSIVSTTTIGSAHKPTTVVTEAGSCFENIIANETIDSRPASPNNRSIVSTATIGSAHKPTTVVTEADQSLVSEGRPPMLLSASPDRSIGSMSQRPTVPPKASPDRSIGSMSQRPTVPPKASPDRSIVSMSQRPTVPPKTSRALAPAPPPPTDFLISKPADCCRPITPNSEVLGSLLDDIYHDMEKFQKMEGASGGGVARDQADAGELQHTISFYRRRQTQSRCSSHHDIDSLSRRPSSFLDSGIAIQSLNSSNTSSEPAPTNEATLKRLQEALIVQQDHIHQASRALAYCRQQEHFRGSAEEIDAQRALLVATEKRRAYLVERDRVIAAQQSAAGADADAAEPRGTLAFSYIAVRLSRDFINMYIQQHSESRMHYFIVLIKHGEHVFHTSMVSSTPTSMKSGYIEFPQYISVAGLTSDFAVTLEVYDMPSPMTRPTEKKRKTARKMVAASLGGSSGSTGSGGSLLSRGLSGKQAPVLETAFRKVGHMTLNRSHLHAAKRFLLTEVLYPLDGVVMLNLQCLSEHTVIVHRGFLSLYQLVSGLGSWTRFWCVLGDGVMSFWRYPEDEERHRDPVVTLELRKCLNDVSEVTNSAASFPHSMQVDVASTPSDGAPTEEIRMLFAADTNEEMISWTEAINKATQYAKIWT